MTKLWNSTLHTRRQRKHVLKPERVIDVEHMQRVKRLGCIVCRNLGRGWVAADAHHIKRNPDGSKLGMRQKAGDHEVIPLCPREHHWNGSEVRMSMSEFEARFGNELELLAQTLALLQVAA